MNQEEILGKVGILTEKYRIKIDKKIRENDISMKYLLVEFANKYNDLMRKVVNALEYDDKKI